MYSQITADERYTLGLLRRLGLRPADIARALGRHRSTIGRELARNTRPDGGYRPSFAQARTGARRWRSRCGDRFTPAEFALVTARLALKWSPEQIAAVLRRTGQLAISHETIYRYIWADKRRGGQLYTHLRGAPKLCRKRYGSYERRGRLTGKRPITERPASIATRVEGGHWEMDTVLGTGDRHCVLSLVERTTGYLVLGKLSARTTAAVTRRAIQLIRRERQPVRTITADNGTEFTTMPASSGRPAPPSTSRPRITPGSAAPTRTPMACCASTSRRATAWPTSRSTIARASLAL